MLARFFLGILMVKSNIPFLSEGVENIFDSVLGFIDFILIFLRVLLKDAKEAF